MSDRIDLDKATVPQLRAFAEIALGLEIGERDTKQTIIGKMQAAGFAGTSIGVFHDAARGAPAAPARVNGRNRRLREGTEADPVYEVQILIPASEQPGGQEPVRLEVNGRAIFVPRSEPVWLAEKYVEVLEHATQYVYQEYTDGMGGLSTPREVQNYPFAFV